MVLEFVAVVLQVSWSCVVERTKFGFKLNGSVLSSFISSSHENCSDTCAKSQSCASYNFHLVTFTCQLLESSSQSQPEELVHVQDWIYMTNADHVCYGISCQGRGPCSMVDDSYYCHCPVNYTGKHCEGKSNFPNVRVVQISVNSKAACAFRGRVMTEIYFFSDWHSEYHNLDAYYLLTLLCLMFRVMHTFRSLYGRISTPK